MWARSAEKDVEAGRVEPGDPMAHVEPVRPRGGAGVAGQEPGDGVPDTLTDRVDVAETTPRRLEWR
jgi:hypothetical protein